MTKDHDRKALIRARMEKTGESYTAARHQLFGETPADEPVDLDRFAMPADEKAAALRLQTRELIDRMYEHSGAAVEGEELHVWMGDPPVFDTRIPLSSIRAAERLPDREGGSLGVHGARGRWLVNSAYSGLVKLTIDPPATAVRNGGNAIPDAAKEVRGVAGRIVRYFNKEKRLPVKELTISVSDPDALVAASLGARGGSVQAQLQV